MIRRLFLCLALVWTLNAATLRLYLTDGSYHKVREYEKLEDRVRFYSTERGQWEEIPLELVDLKKTENEITRNEQARKKEAKFLDAEEKAERAQADEISRIPWEAGVFMADGKEMLTLKAAESSIVNNKRRSILKVLTPIPVVAGKSTIELEKPQAAFAVAHTQPEFYIRMARDERFGIAKLTPTKNGRIVQKWSIVPVTNEIIEETEMIETFKQQMADGLYKLWPTQPLAPGEYAVVQYTEGKGNIQVWDFSIPAK